MLTWGRGNGSGGFQLLKREGREQVYLCSQDGSELVNWISQPQPHGHLGPVVLCCGDHPVCSRRAGCVPGPAHWMPVTPLPVVTTGGLFLPLRCGRVSWGQARPQLGTTFVDRWPGLSLEELSLLAMPSASLLEPAAVSPHDLQATLTLLGHRPRDLGAWRRGKFGAAFGACGCLPEWLSRPSDTWFCLDAGEQGLLGSGGRQV